MKKKKTAMLEIKIFLIFWLEEIEILTKLIERKIQGKWIMKKEKYQFLLYFILFLYFCPFSATYQTQHFLFNSNQIKQTMVFIKCQNTTSITTPTSPSPNSHPIPTLLPSMGILGFGMDFRLGLTVLKLLLD